MCKDIARGYVEMDLDADRLIMSVSRWLHVSPKPRRIDWSKPAYGYVALIVAAVILAVAAVTQ
jgi:hypothetical protein